MTTSGHRSPPFARRMKLPTKLMIAFHVSTAPLYVSHRMDWKESSRAPSLASSSARSLPAAVKRPASSSLACSALDKCALHFRHRVDVGLVPNVSEAFPDSPPNVSVRPSCRCAPFRPTLQASEHCRTIRYERRSWLRQEDGLPQRPQFCPQDTPLHWERSAWHHTLSKPTRGKSRGLAPLPACPPCDPCLHIKEPSTNSLPPKLLPTTLGCIHT